MLFTAFEPSGDDHAAAVIAELRRREPGLPIYAWGGPKMERAGAALVGRTGGNAVMGLPGPRKIAEHLAIKRDIRCWMRERLAAVHVPVDSPAANFPVCALARRAGMRIVHLVAPQMWAWGEWRKRKLRRLTDKVLCLLPFEEDWFQQRGIPARFIGHPLFDQPLDLADLDRRAARIGADGSNGASGGGGGGGGGGSPRVALMPGSRPAELRASWPRLLDAFKRLSRDFPSATGVVAATTPQVAAGLRERARSLGDGVWPERLSIVAGDTDAVIRWCDYALVVSGTVTLQIARQHKPMATFYCPNRLMFETLGRLLVSTRFYTLPNLIAERAVVPELIPYYRADGEDLALEVIKFMRRTNYADDQRRELAQLCKRFEGRNAAVAAAQEILGALGPAAG